MKHNIRTLFEVLNRYLDPKRESIGLIPMTPMHMELNKMKRELRAMIEREEQRIDRVVIVKKAMIWVMKEVLGE